MISSHDGRLFAAYEGQRVRVFETVSGQVKANIATAAGSGLACLAFLLDGERLATVDIDRECFWNIADGKPQRSIWNATAMGRHLFFPQVAACSPDGRILAAGAMQPGGRYSGTLQLWDIASGKEIAALRGDQMGVADLVFSPDSKTLVLSAIESPPRLRLWHAAVREEVALLRKRIDVGTGRGTTGRADNGLFT